MTSASGIQLAVRTIRRSPVKAVLTGTGLLLGVLAITLTVASGGGARRAVERQWRAMVGNLDALFISPGGPAQRGMATMENSIASLKQEDALAIAAGVPNVQAVAIEQSAFGVPIRTPARTGTTALLGVSPNWVTLRGDRVTSGAMLTPEQNESVARVVVLGSDVARDYFPPGGAVGGRLDVGGVSFDVVGVLEPNGAGPGGASMDNLVLVPVNTTARRVFNRAHINSIRVQMKEPDRSDETAAAITRLLRERHQLAPGQIDDFRISTPRAMMARRQNVDTSLRRTILYSGLLALLLGGVMVANLMFAGTAQRAPEIGVRRAMGATRADIMRQFWLEGVMIAGLAGALGVVLSLGAIGVGSRALGYQLAASWPVTAAALVATIAIGLVAAYFPARRAAGLPPADALRRQE
jgi:putative ABC transport system permease protein